MLLICLHYSILLCICQVLFVEPSRQVPHMHYSAYKPPFMQSSADSSFPFIFNSLHYRYITLIILINRGLIVTFLYLGGFRYMLTKVFPSPGGVNFWVTEEDSIGNSRVTCLSVRAKVVPSKPPCKPKYYTVHTPGNKGIHTTIWYTVLETKVHTHVPVLETTVLRENTYVPW